jgi:hypothetical protein
MPVVPAERRRRVNALMASPCSAGTPDMLSDMRVRGYAAEMYGKMKRGLQRGAGHADEDHNGTGDGDYGAGVEESHGGLVHGCVLGKTGPLAVLSCYA